MKSSHYILFFSILWFTSCNEKPIETNLPVTKLNSLQHIKCKNDTSNSYELYLPLEYNNSEKWPVIFVFDPHGDGGLPLDSLKLAAEQFGYILIGSNSVSNNALDINKSIQILFDDALNNYSIDDRRIYTCGFSGGARVAFSVAMGYSGIKGTVLCGAGIPENTPDPAGGNLNVCLIAGEEDFNFPEVLNVEKTRHSGKINFYLQTFNGGHSWPAGELLKNSLFWFQFEAMKNKTITRDNKLIETYYNHVINTGKNAEESGQLKLAYDIYQQGNLFLTGLKSVKKLHKKTVEISKKADYQDEIRLISAYIEKEGSLRQSYYNNILTKDTSWWKNEVKKLEDLYNSEKELHVKAFYKRVKNYLGILMYSLSKQFLTNSDIVKASEVISRYECIEPLNPDCYFFKAVLYSKQGNLQASKKAFEQALKLGFSDNTLAKQLLPSSIL